MSNTNPSKGPRAPHLALTQMYERKTWRGERYLVGRVGILKLMILETPETSKGDRVWWAYIAESPHSVHAPADGAQLLQEAEAGAP